jgi:adenine phosphoribosyltransferase
MSLRSLIRTIPDFPKKGIMFRDVTTLMKDADGFRLVIEQMAERYQDKKIELIAGIEARGFILGAALAFHMGLGFIPIRKKGKLPGKTIREDYELEYGTDSIEVHVDAIVKGQRLVLVDDLIATGGTAIGASNLIKKSGGELIEAIFLVNLPELKGGERLTKAGIKYHSMIDFEGH